MIVEAYSARDGHVPVDPRYAPVAYDRERDVLLVPALGEPRAVADALSALLDDSVTGIRELEEVTRAALHRADLSGYGTALPWVDRYEREGAHEVAWPQDVSPFGVHALQPHFRVAIRDVRCMGTFAPPRSVYDTPGLAVWVRLTVRTEADIVNIPRKLAEITDHSGHCVATLIEHVKPYCPDGSVDGLHLKSVTCPHGARWLDFHRLFVFGTPGAGSFPELPEHCVLRIGLEEFRARTVVAEWGSDEGDLTFPLGQPEPVPILVEEFAPMMITDERMVQGMLRRRQNGQEWEPLHDVHPTLIAHVVVPYAPKPNRVSRDARGEPIQLNDPDTPVSLPDPWVQVRIMDGGALARANRGRKLVSLPGTRSHSQGVALHSTQASPQTA